MAGLELFVFYIYIKVFVPGPFLSTLHALGHGINLFIIGKIKEKGT